MLHVPRYASWKSFNQQKVTLKVTQSHWYCCQLIGHIRFPISLPLQLCLYLALFPYYQLFTKTERGHVTTNTSFSGVMYQACTSANQHQSACQICLCDPMFIYLPMWPSAVPMCSRAWRTQWPRFDSAWVRPPTKELFLIIPMHMINRDSILGR